MYIKEYWIRDNVLKSIFNELLLKEKGASYKQEQIIGYGFKVKEEFTYKNLKKLIKKYGKTNKQIANEVKAFIYKGRYTSEKVELRGIHIPIRFYTYYGDYDWVVFCWLFGKMIDLPKRFPMYSCDLKQMLDEVINKKNYTLNDLYNTNYETTQLLNFNEKLKHVKSFEYYPKQENEHNALSDAKWNKKLHNFIKSM